MTAVGRQREREIASFDEGELWCADDAVPPLNPAGWYFRVARGGVWVGPFDGAADAGVAPASGDPLRDARKYLDRWRRGGEAPPPKIVVFRRPPPLPPMNGDGQFELAVGAATPPPAKPLRRPVRRAARTQQLPLSLTP
ncbi:hypothetical protein ACFOMD_13965 [Sphingoaurantiacus capsulatus]|uniref:Uncharacterized protein n=1 Tax=Sphingoaurantiacus capsulatus TaxID=1771310 RepID=A0ABV7XCX9_9SPHN